jgi:rhodanese-related sulfurtransferase
MEHETSLRKVAIALCLSGAFLGLAVSLFSRAAPSGTVNCHSADCLAPRQIVSPREAWRMRRLSHDHALLVDVRGPAETFYNGMPLGVDAQIPFTEPAVPFAWNAAEDGPQMEFRTDFRWRMDEVLRAKHVRHDEPVILLCRTGERAVLAALLLQEHGYSNVYIVRDGFEGRLAYRADGTEMRMEGGWKSAGLPWTAHVEPRWAAN